MFIPTNRPMKHRFAFLVLGDGYVRQMWGYIWGELLKAILTEPEPDVKVLLMESCARVGFMICPFINYLNILAESS